MPTDGGRVSANPLCPATRPKVMKRPEHRFERRAGPTVRGYGPAAGSSSTPPGDPFRAGHRFPAPWCSRGSVSTCPRGASGPSLPLAPPSDTQPPRPRTSAPPAPTTVPAAAQGSLFKAALNGILLKLGPTPIECRPHHRKISPVRKFPHLTKLGYSVQNLKFMILWDDHWFEAVEVRVWQAEPAGRWRP